ncbi:MAG: hypothetical protein HFK03_02780 [Clostridia bacterium]|jgi:exopolyphosphatase/guanosine-5'-triphosphate,3'-diphosphate pyrophosphatase|nr:hypothetical protein [Clostridia bacterium]
MKISAIDIGSNSVRLALVSDGKTLYKRIRTTRLGEGLSFSDSMKDEAIERTALAVADFVNRAKAEKTDKLYAFATAAVRSASNKAQFLARVKELCGLEIDVISGETEAKIGILGALGNNDGGIIDVGGASTEVTFRAGGRTVYSKSVNVGTVRLFDLAARNKQKLLRIISEKIEEYGEFSAENVNMRAIGGTATRLAAIKHNLLQYTPEVTDGTNFTVGELEKYADGLLSTSVEIIRANTICSASAEVIGGGCLLLAEIMKKLKIKSLTVSERDNLEGYIIYKEGAL